MTFVSMFFFSGMWIDTGKSRSRLIVPHVWPRAQNARSSPCDSMTERLRGGITIVRGSMGQDQKEKVVVHGGRRLDFRVCRSNGQLPFLAFNYRTYTQIVLRETRGGLAPPIPL